MGRQFTALLLALITAGLIWPCLTVADPDVVISPESVSATSGTAEKRITVANETSGTISVIFSVEPNGDGVSVAPSPSPTVTLSSYQVQEVPLTFTSEKMNYEGFLVARTSRPDEPSASPPPAMVPLALHPGMHLGSLLVIVITLAGAAALIILRWAWGRRSANGELKKASEAATQDAADELAWWHLGTRMGGVEWDYSKSYGSDFAVFAGIVGLVFTAGLLPSDAGSKGSFVGLQLLFAALVVVAPVVYAATQEKREPPQAEKLQPPQADFEPDWRPITTRLEASTPAGPVKGILTSTRAPEKLKPEVLGAVGWFLTASGITCWAVFGQALTLFLLLWNIWAVQGLPDAVTLILGAANIVLVALIVVYFWKTIGWILEKQARGAMKSADGKVPDFTTIAGSAPDRPTWTPL